jgi:hypothetical protein
MKVTDYEIKLNKDKKEKKKDSQAIERGQVNRCKITERITERKQQTVLPQLCITHTVISSFRCKQCELQQSFKQLQVRLRRWSQLPRLGSPMLTVDIRFTLVQPENVMKKAEGDSFLT